MRKIFTKAVIASVVVVMGLSGCSSNKNEEKTTASETEAVTEEVLDEATIGDAAVSNEEEASSSDASDKVADASEMTTIEDVVEEGMVLNVHGKGNAGPRNGVAGDIQVMIEEEKNDTFVRDKQDVIYNLLLDFPTAALGGEAEIPTIDGKQISLKIDAGTQPGKSVRLRGKGLPAVKGYGSGVGDLIVNMSVYVPKTLNKKEKKAIEELRESENFQGDSSTKKSIFEKFRNYFN